MLGKVFRALISVATNLNRESQIEFEVNIMELNQIEVFLASPNPQNRIKALVALKEYEPDTVVPLLKQRLYDQQFVVRSFVAMGLGNKRTEEGFAALLSLIEHERDPNVIAEVANSLEKFGPHAIPHLVQLFEANSHWLVRQSIFAALEGVEPDILLQLCRWGWEGEDRVVKGTAIANLKRLSDTPQAADALELLIEAAMADLPLIRVQAARSLQAFDHPRAKSALSELRMDSNPQVVGAALESLV
ncbi:MAG: HEAT repeat domain-containing protein [Nodosilinea sp.]